MDVDQLATTLHAQTAAIATVLAETDLERRVPTCPEWRVRDLIGHVGQSLRWSAGIARTGEASPVPSVATVELPAAWAEWLRESAEELATAVTADPTAQVWTFFGPRSALFWLRRMVSDVTIHHADAALVDGDAPEISAELAGEVVTECLEIFSDPITPSLRPVLLELRGTGQTILFRTIEGEGWLVTREPGEIRVGRTSEEGADVVVTARSHDLVWLFSRRLTADDPRVTVTGDRALLDHWLERTAF
ncbi:maleylpyruvate isomerase family mycothiol-dependent enzyme [Actinokineospora enzanensis]|uniref:maleylpyruvate isomerase family mycothiol-dependent enzyme n=1 Tax=Actinokineospora enzanensis TaxID=155975 RepID=UPI00037D3B79|nr:maleylpyruvate isomerase family mycothiol-dependent enzyme [Actinokineospora enzanensis]